MSDEAHPYATETRMENTSERMSKKRYKKKLFSPKIRKNAMRYGNGAADNMLSVFQITNEENACLSLKKQAQFLKLHSISGRSFAPLKKIVIVVA